MARATMTHRWARAIACVLLIPVLLARSSTAGMLVCCVLYSLIMVYLLQSAALNTEDSLHQLLRMTAVLTI